jgi:hypothetical protein
MLLTATIKKGWQNLVLRTNIQFVPIPEYYTYTTTEQSLNSQRAAPVSSSAVLGSWTTLETSKATLQLAVVARYSREVILYALVDGTVNANAAFVVCDTAPHLLDTDREQRNGFGLPYSIALLTKMYTVNCVLSRLLTWWMVF